MSADACIRIQQAVAAGNAPDPKDVKDCERWKNMLEFIKYSYLVKLIVPPRPPALDGEWGQFFGDPSPQPNIKDHLFSEIILDRLRRDPTPGPMAPVPDIFSQIRESGAQLDVVQGLIQEFEAASQFLKAELEYLQDHVDSAIESR